MLWPSVALFVGLLLASGIWEWNSTTWMRGFGAALILLALLALTTLAMQLKQPRLAFAQQALRFYLRPQGPICVPIEFVEGFLLGRAPSGLPNKAASLDETTTIVVRLAERATEWERIEVDRSLGTWCGHYVTIRGTWCEPLSVDLVNRLNARLHEVKQEATTQQADAPVAL